MDEEENINPEGATREKAWRTFYDNEGRTGYHYQSYRNVQRLVLDYASYVILERAVPAIEDGFKPVQRRIMHS
jgi:topoisomerase-4 subunit A